MDSLVATTPPANSLDVLDAVQRRVLWLATSIVHHANRVRSTPSGVKVGGHQASSASMVSIMSALYFEHLRAPDRVSVKPHAAPVLHAINYLLGRLDPAYLTELRAFGGLQSYPSRAKDPDPVDFSTGSVGIGATATLWSALAHRYVAGHFEVPQGGRHVALLGDAELDEGAIWEALVDPVVPSLGEVLWIVDLNRQSLDRVVPDVAAGRIGAMFEAAGWQTITVKYGRLLRELFARDGGEALRERIDAMPNPEYQRLLRSPAAELRERLPGDGATAHDVRRIVADLEDAELIAAIRDLGGHDLADLREAFARADSDHARPTIIFAYTIKAWSLATEGHPANHSALLSEPQWRALAGETGADADDPWARFDAGVAGGRDVPRRGRAPGAARAALAAPAARAAGRRARARREGLDAAGVRALLRRPRPRGTRRRRARRDGQPGRRVVDEPRRLDQPRRRLAPRRAGRLVRRRQRHARALARVRARPPHRARHRRGQPRRAARRARRDVVARRPAAAADRDDVRPVPRARARAVDVRDLRGRAVDPRRHPVRGHARAGGRRAPVDHHAVDRAGDAALHRVGAGVRAGPRVGAARRARAPRHAGRDLGLPAPEHPADRPVARRGPLRPRGARAPARARAGRRLPGARARRARPP